MLGVEAPVLFSMERNAALGFLLLVVYMGFTAPVEQMIATADGRSVTECVSRNCRWNRVCILNVVICFFLCCVEADSTAV